MSKKNEAQNTALPLNQMEHFQEVEVRRLFAAKEGDKYVTRFEKLKVLRRCVKITRAQADILNEGVKADAGNRIFLMYLKEDEEITPLYHKHHTETNGR